ncbi:hypothetical protein [Salsuginibacillus kocurii]|uniref:hypothetical protein n=1 Tax=Salsuginibacillus kocurii TaxID=427078 RepID=UPI00035EC9BA|nr:hypothetical protein [Salsuginibacillus kocurii]
MAETLAMIFLSIVLSLDGAVTGFIFASKRIPIHVLDITAISCLAVLIMGLAMFFGSLFSVVFPIGFIELLDGLLFIAIGVYQWVGEVPLYQRNLIISIAILVNIDVLAFGLQAGMMDRSYAFTFWVGCCLFAALVSGILLGEKLRHNPYLLQLGQVLPGVLFILIGLFKLIH